MGFNFNLRNGTRYNEPGTSGFVLQIIENNNSPIISNDEAVTDPQYHDSRTDMPRVYGLVCQTMRVGLAQLLMIAATHSFLFQVLKMDSSIDLI